ncbi:MAG: tetratricopeptide repeat protein [Bacteroidales bacterium]|nr:MAG: tetratricopeptide repeat protein [Bacteroidales bacterium]
MNKKPKISILFILIACGLPKTNYGQNIDSLFTTLQYAQDTLTKVRLNIEVANYYYNKERNNKEAENYLLVAKKLSEDQSKIALKILASNELGVFYRNLSRYSEALSLHTESLFQATQINDKKAIAASLNNIGVVYRRLDDRTKAAEYHIQALKISEETNDIYNISVSHNSLGNIYSLNGSYEQALSHFIKGLELSEKQKNLLGVAINYNNIGEVYENAKNYEKAKEYYSKSLEINKRLNNDKGIAISLNALGKTLLFTGFPKTALKYFTDASEIDKKIGDKHFITDSYINLGRALIMLQRYDEAKQCLNQGIKIAEETKSRYHLQIANSELCKIYAELNDFRKALHYFQKSTIYKDSVLNEKATKQIATLQMLFETEKKEKENQILKQKQEINDKESKRQKYFIYSLSFGLFFCLGLIVAVYLALLSKRRANRLLFKQKQEIEEQNHKIEQQKHNIEVKNRNIEEAYQIIENYIGKITDSIRYAEQIQKSILPDIELLKTIFEDTFTFYKPKDIVSGDFYWFTVRGDRVYIALADCTGHGVPGAFMSIIGIDLLNQVVIQQGCEEPDKILTFLNHELREKLRKGKEELILKDSMDIALCIIDKKTREVSYSGALIPLFIVSNGEANETKPNYTSLGASNRLFNKEFRIHKFTLNPNSWLYLTTDGYIDQFGGEQNKKFMRTRFVEFILKVNHLPANVQRDELENQFNTWMGEHEQLDDVLVWGIKV